MGTALVAINQMLDTTDDDKRREKLALIHYHGEKLARWSITSSHVDTIDKEHKDLRFHADRVHALVQEYLGPDPAVFVVTPRKRKRRKATRKASRKRR